MLPWKFAVCSWKPRSGIAGIHLGQQKRLTNTCYVHDLMLYSTSCEMTYTMESLIRELKELCSRLSSQKTNTLTTMAQTFPMCLDLNGSHDRTLHDPETLTHRIREAWRKCHVQQLILQNKNVSIKNRTRLDAVVSRGELSASGSGRDAESSAAHSNWEKELQHTPPPKLGNMEAYWLRKQHRHGQ